MKELSQLILTDQLYLHCILSSTPKPLPWINNQNRLYRHSAPRPGTAERRHIGHGLHGSRAF